jgi:hypothetical protein
MRPIARTGTANGTRAARSFCLAAALLLCQGVHAAGTAAAPDRMMMNLPVLPGENEPAPGYFSIDEQSAAVGYEARHEKGNAKVEEYLDLEPLLTLDYGRQLTSTFGAGASLVRQGDQSRLQVNAVFAPARRLRIHFAGEQSVSGGPSDGVVRNGFFTDIKRVWGKTSVLSDVGLGAYTVHADGADYTDLSALENADSDALVERVDGFMLDLGLRPSANSRLELRREQGYLRRMGSGGNGRDAFFAANHLSYSRYLGDCTKLQGSYIESGENRAWGLHIGKDNWSVNLSRAIDAGPGDVTLSVGVTIPLGGRTDRHADCGSEFDGAPEFESIVDAAIAHSDESRTDLSSSGLPMGMNE